MKKTILFILSICAYLIMQAQCTIVKEDGSVSITSTLFNDKAIERQDNGSWVQVGNLNNGTFVDNTVNANTQSITYSITVNNTRTLFSTIFCEVAIKTNDNSIVAIKWTTQSNATKYKIYKKTIDDDDFVFLTDVNTSQNSYEDNKSNNCEILYRIEAILTDCSSFSNIASLPKSDNEGPENPILHPIDVDLSSQKVVVTWEKVTSTDARGYVICKIDENGIRKALDTIYDINTTTYICNNCNVKDTNRIAIFAFDGCKNTSPLSETVNNIVLNAERSNCNEPLHLTWNAPNDTYTGLISQIYMATDENMEYKQIATITHDLKYDITLPQINGNIYIYVMSGGRSNVIKINVANADTLSFVYLEGVSILPDNFHAQIYVFLDASKKVKGYKLYRKMDDGQFEEVKFITFNGNNYFKFIDDLPLSASEHIYSYYLAAPDICETNFTYSNQITAMQLSIDASNQSKIKLSWQPFKPVNWTVSGYEVYRFAENDFENAEFIGKTVANSYTDDVENIVSATDRTYYYIKAITSSSANTDINTYGINSSNTFVKFESILFIPNAFSPKDGNHDNLRTFKPACHFVRAGSYSFKVFSRSGQLLFETNDTNKGWDGQYENKFCPVGTYIYKVSFIDSDGMEQNQGGTFLLYD